MLRFLVRIAAALAIVIALLVWALWPYRPPLPELGGRFGEGTVSVDGIERRYEFYVPADLPENAPLLFVIHGSGIDIPSTRDWTAARFEAVADRERVLIAYPEGFGLEWNGCRNPQVSEADRRNVDDTGFISGLIDRFADSHAIDRSRVYAVGFSNGGQMTYRLASDVPERFAAVAILIAQVPAPENSDCPAPAGPIPILIMNGTADPIIPWHGGTAAFFFGISARGRVLSTAESVDHWRRVNGIASQEPAVERLLDHDPDDGSRVERSIWRDAGNPNEVVLYAIHGGGHAIPGGIELGSRAVMGRLIGYTNRDIDTADELWSFFSRHRR